VKPLGKTQRRILIAAELYRRKHGHAPLWRELRCTLGLTKAELPARMRALRKQGLLTYTTDEPRSLRVTPEGIAAALDGKGPRPA
jgi:RIO-like serine/threonine protein kinase